MNKKTCYLSIDKTCEFLKLNNNYLIVTHSSPDGDTLGSGFALKFILKQLNKKAKVICFDEIPQKYSYFTEPNEDFKEQTVITVDVADLNLTSGLESSLKNKVNLAIDHHKSNTEFAENLLLEENSASCCEIILKIAEHLNVKINGKTADALYTGVCTDTGCFKFSNTTADTFYAAAKLKTLGANTEKINRLMFETKTKQQLKIEQMALDTAEYFFNDKCMMIFITEEMIAKAGCKQNELDAVSSVPRTVEGVLVGVTIKQKGPEEFKISVRTHEPYDASKICGILNGGGHIRAAGCTVNGNLEFAKKQILSAVERVIGV